jgi:hypothetical protein
MEENEGETVREPEQQEQQFVVEEERQALEDKVKEQEVIISALRHQLQEAAEVLLREQVKTVKRSKPSSLQVQGRALTTPHPADVHALCQVTAQQLDSSAAAADLSLSTMRTLPPGRAIQAAARSMSATTLGFHDLVTQQWTENCFLELSGPGLSSSRPLLSASSSLESLPGAGDLLPELGPRPAAPFNAKGPATRMATCLVPGTPLAPAVTRAESPPPPVPPQQQLVARFVAPALAHSPNSGTLIRHSTPKKMRSPAPKPAPKPAPATPSQPSHYAWGYPILFPDEAI